MKQQYIKLFSFLLGISFILSAVIFVYVKDYKDEKQEKVKSESIIADEIGNVYKTFYKKAKEINTYRDSLNKDLSNYLVYYSNMQKGYKNMVSKYTEYETKLKELEDISSYLKEKCVDKYSVSNANEKCNAYYINLEKATNIFIEDIIFFNSKIKEYNEWTEVENKSVIATVKYKKLDEYKSEKYTDYVDLNKDGTYLGMSSK